VSLTSVPGVLASDVVCAAQPQEVQMREMLSFFVLMLAALACVADEKKEGKKHEYEPGKLPKVVKLKAGDSIVVTYKINPADVEDIKSKSDNGDVTVTTEAGNGVIKINVRLGKKGQAQIEWVITQANGKVEGVKELKIEFE
jgi:hypothetical protein